MKSERTKTGTVRGSAPKVFVGGRRDGEERRLKVFAALASSAGRIEDGNIQGTQRLDFLERLKLIGEEIGSNLRHTPLVVQIGRNSERLH